MFARTFSFWRRLVGKSSAPADTQAAMAIEDDRRLWVRYATDLQRNVQLGKNQHAEKILAQVRDLSVGGANLVVDRRIEPGQMLSLELLADGEETQTVLACVVRAIEETNGRWALGCVFSRELDSEDLHHFGAQKIPAAADDKRTWARFPGQIKAQYRHFGDLDGDSQPTKVLNISASGIGLLMQASLEAGSLLNVDLLDKNDRKVCSILACVVHVAHHADSEFAVGCNFIRELSDEELESLMDA